MRISRFIVTGRVQGVGYRFFVAAMAAEKGLRGFVRNVSDGSVEVVAAGLPSDVAAIRLALALGPPLARVADVLEEEYRGDADWDSFEIRQV